MEIFCRSIAALYLFLNPARREVVVKNFLPLTGNDRAQARALSRELLKNFAQKLVDLWRYETGVPIETLFGDLTGWDNFIAAQNQKRGVLIVTPHLGNWELGAPLLAARGFKMLVITLDEPDARLTEMREQARKRWGIETLVIGKNPFAFVDIIRQLENGATVALLMDRPPENSSVSVRLFGEPFSASVAASELARASGCVLLPVYLPRERHGYAAHILPEIDYDRAALRSADARQQLTQKILDVFEKPIRDYATQWFHFVPLWKNNGK